MAPKIDCVLVFGAAVHKGSVSGPGIERRVKTAANLYTSGIASRLLLTGGKGDEIHDSEAEVMRRTAMRYGVAPEDIYLEDKATSTWENLMYSRIIANEMACIAPIVGISDGYHLARIRFLAFRQGWEHFRTLPAGDRPDIVFERLSILREVLGILYYSLDIFIDVDGN
ncbi:MAG: YdcF family protein [Candidatus Peribacteraceae bacterium]|nr:YdcF family protein [Candidatus Peribacteraceae bacterium]